jgi:hypothetical protein
MKTSRWPPSTATKPNRFSGLYHLTVPVIRLGFSAVGPSAARLPGYDRGCGGLVDLEDFADLRTFLTDLDPDQQGGA